MNEIITNAKDKQNKSGLDCPILLWPKCHPNSHFMVHVDGKKQLIYLSCAACDRTIAVIQTKKGTEL